MNDTNFFPRMHVSLYVSDIEATIQFYDIFFGQAPNKIRFKYAKYILEKPSLIISFIENKERVQSNFGHLGFQVEQVEEMQHRLALAKANGLVTREEMGTNCCYAIQDKFWVTDPDGFQWEVYYFHQDSSFNDPFYEEKKSEQCCIVEDKCEVDLSKNFIELPTLKTCNTSSGCC